MDAAELFTFDERLGIYFSVQSACLSAASVLVLLGYALTRWLKRVRILRRDSARVQTEVTDSSLFLNLMVADLVQAIGIMPSIRWMREGRINEGSLCTAQAVIKQIGINGVALTSLAIAVHTFSVLILRWRAPRHISKYLVLGVWAMTALVVGIPYAVHRKDTYYGNTGYWCWVVTKFKTEQLVSEYLWVWIAAILMAVLYGIMFLVMRGFVVVEKGIRWRSAKERVKLDLDEAEGEEERETRTIANLLLFYPAVYIVCVFPNTLSRWLYFSGKTIPYQVTLFSSALFAFSGMFNVVLFFVTRPELVKGQTIIPDTAPTASPTSPHVHSKYGHLPFHHQTEATSTSNGSNVDDEKRATPTSPTGSYGTRVLLDSQVYQSPPSAPRTASLPYTSPVSATGHAQATGQSTLRHPHNVSRDDDEEEEDYGRLPG